MLRSHSSESFIVRSCFELFSFVPTFLSSIFRTTFAIILVSEFSSYFTLARGIQCGIHISCMGSSFPAK